MTNLFEPKFTISEMAKATGVDAGTIRSWYQRGHISVGMHDKQAAANGLARHFSAATVIMVAIVERLARRGFHPKRAAEAAIHFCHLGETGFVWEGDDHLHDRSPGMLFSSPAQDTLLVIGEGITNFAHVVPLCADDTYDTIRQQCNIQLDELFTVLPLFNTVNRVRLQLGLTQDNS